MKTLKMMTGDQRRLDGLRCEAPAHSGDHLTRAARGSGNPDFLENQESKFSQAALQQKKQEMRQQFMQVSRAFYDFKF